MATYLQGVTDFIPDYQPFQPDYNFYATALQTKQTQYDTNWKQLNNLYGQLYGAELTHDQNIKKKDELLKQIDFNLKRVSGLDLSLEQNVNQAMQVFRPFYEDKYLMKDMAWTKNWTNTYNSSNALKASQDKEQRKQWWATGIQGLELRRQMFKDATLDETLTMRNAQYTPFVNTIREYMDLAKKYNVSKTVEIPHPSGMYFIKKKNGEVLLPTLQQLFSAEYANRPDIQDMYREKAFVERMGYAYQNAEKFGSAKEAEKEYIRGKMNWLKKYTAAMTNTAEDDLETTQELQGSLEQEVRKGNVTPRQANYGKSLEELFGVESAIVNNSREVSEQLNDNQSTATVEGYQDEKDIGDIELARMKVDAGYASVYAQEDIKKAALGYADLNSSVTWRVNQVGLAGLKHRYKQKEIEQIASNKAWQKVVDAKVKSGEWHYDEKGELKRYPQDNGYNLTTVEPGDAGQTTGEEDTKTFEELQNETRTRLIAENSGGVDHIMKTIQLGVDRNKKFTKAQLAKLVEQFNHSNPVARKILDSKGSKGSYEEIKEVWNTVFESYKNDPNKFYKDMLGSNRIFNVKKSLESWMTKHDQDPLTLDYIKDPSVLKLEQYGRAEEAMVNIENENYQKIETAVSNKIKQIAKTAANEDPGLTYDQERVDAAVQLLMRRYVLDAKGDQTAFNEMAAEVDEQISGILGFNIGMNTDAPSEMGWENYVFPWTNLFQGDRTNTKSRASWVKDVYDLTYEDLIKQPNTEGQLSSYFSNYLPLQSKGDPSSADKFALGSQTTAMQVHPGSYTDAGNIAARDAFDRILKTTWDQDFTKYRISLNGNIRPEDPEAGNDLDTKTAMDIIQTLKSKMLLKNMELDPFVLKSSSISMEDSSLGSMTIKLPKALLEEVVKSVEGGDDKAVKAEIDRISKMGLTFIAPNNVWEGNPLYNKQFPTAAEVVLRNKPIEYEDPSGNGYYKIEKVPGKGDYLINGIYRELKPDGSVEEHYMKYDLDSKAGREIESREMVMWKTIQSATELNFKRYRQIVNSGNEEAKLKAEKNFSTSLNGSFWINN
jgi:hypothetical protein